MVPPSRRYYWRAPTPCLLPAALAWARGAVPPPALLVPLGMGTLALRWRDQGLPGSCGTPLCTCPALRPRRFLDVRPSCGIEVLPSVFRTTSASAANSISRLNHAARALAVYASQPGLP